MAFSLTLLATAACLVKVGKALAPEPAKTFWGDGACFGSDMAGGIVGNLIASAGCYFLKIGTSQARAALMESLRTGGTNQNHDLLRALRWAECEALAALCELTLLRDHQVQANIFTLLREDDQAETAAEAAAGTAPTAGYFAQAQARLDAWQHRVAATHASEEVQMLLAIRRDFRRLGREVQKATVQDLRWHAAAFTTDVPALLRGAAEILPAADDPAARAVPLPDADQPPAEPLPLRTRVTSVFLGRLRATFGDTLPPSLARAVEERWFEALRFAFRERLKTDPAARNAFQTDVLADLPVKLDDLLARLARLDVAVDRLHDEVALQFSALRGEMHGRFDEVVARLDRLLRLARDQFEILPFRPELPATGGSTESELLRPQTRSFPLLGRDEDLAELLAWAHDPGTPAAPKPAVSVRVIGVGPGAGKTRLGFEFLLRLQADKGETWTIGSVSAESLGKFREAADWDAWDWDRPTVVVVDYADTALVPLQRWLAQLAKRLRAAGHQKPPFRLLLLDRPASAESLIAKLLAVGDSATVGSLRPWFVAEKPLGLRPLPDAAIRRAVLAAGLDAFARATGRPLPSVPSPGQEAAFDTALTGDDWRDPLYLLFAAWEIVAGAAPLAALRLGRSQLVQNAATRERHRLQKLADPSGTDEARQTVLLHLAAYATLAYGLSEAEAKQAAAEEMAALGATGTLTPLAAAQFLHRALGEPGRHAGPVRPDVVGERLVFGWLAGLPDADARAALFTRALRLAGERAFPVLWRTAADLPAAEAGAFTGWLAVTAAAWAGTDLDLLDRLEAALPRFHTGLLLLAAEVARLQTDRARVIAETSREPDQLARLANRLNTLGVRLSEAGYHDDALTPSEEAVKICRALTAQNWAAHAPNLAGSLSNLALRLNALGRKANALTPIEEAVQVYRELARQNWAAYAPNLAGVLNNLGAHLSGLGQQADALALSEEAVMIRRNLAAQNWTAYAPDLAGSLNNLGIRLSELGRKADALAPSEEAAKIRREFAAQNWAAYAPDLAAALINLGIRLGELGRKADALAPSEEAVRIYRDLAEQNWAAYAPDLATALSNLGALLSELEQQADALAPSEEAVMIRRNLAAWNWTAYAPDLAKALNNLGALWGELGRKADALALGEEAVKTFRELAEQNWAAYAPALATALGAQGQVLVANARPAEALASFAGGIQVLTGHLRQLPAAHAPLMRALGREYLRLAEATGTAPDEALLAPVAEVFQRLQGP